MQRTGLNNARSGRPINPFFWLISISKSQLSQLTGLSIPAVSNILAELLSEDDRSFNGTLEQTGREQRQLRIGAAWTP